MTLFDNLSIYLHDKYRHMHCNIIHSKLICFVKNIYQNIYTVFHLLTDITKPYKYAQKRVGKTTQYLYHLSIE